MLLPFPVYPPTAIACQLCSSTAERSVRRMFKLPVTPDLPLVGSSSSALFNAPVPAAIKTCPLFSKLAVWKERALFKLSVGLNVPVAGWYMRLLFWPPATSTSPVSRVVCVRQNFLSRICESCVERCGRRMSPTLSLH